MCTLCDTITYDSYIPQPPEYLSTIFEYQISGGESQWCVGVGKCKQCGQEIEFSSECFINEKLLVTKKKLGDRS